MVADHLLDRLARHAQQAPGSAAIPARQRQGLVEHGPPYTLLNLANRRHTDVADDLRLERRRIGQMTDAEIRAIWRYLRSLSPRRRA